MLHLNAVGLQKYTDVYGKTIMEILQDQGPAPMAILQRSEQEKEEVHTVLAPVQIKQLINWKI